MNDLKSILNDLYQLDPSLKSQEAELIKLLETLLETQPELSLDPPFVQNLREQLTQEAQRMTSSPSPLPPNSFMTMIKKLLFPLTGGVLAVGLVMMIVLSNRPTSDDTPLFAQQNEIIKVKPGAFGSLSNFNLGNGNTAKGGEPGIAADKVLNSGPPPSEIPAAPPLSVISPETSSRSTDQATPQPSTEARNTTTTDVAPTSVATAPAGMGGAGVMEGKMMIPPDYVPTIYKYVYKGEPVNLSEQTVEVFKRLPQKSNASSLVTAIKNFGFGLMDLKGLDNLEIQNISLIQDQKEGYMVDLNFVDSMINLYQNWSQWDYPGSQCGDDPDCYENSRLKESDVPTDETLRSIAEDFLKKNNINLANYGEPVIQKYWERDRLIAEKQGLPFSPVFIPDMINLVYPLVLNDKPVSDQWGNPVGLNVGINLYHKKVASVNNLRLNQFQSSAYNAVTDWASIADYLAKGANPFPIYYETTQVNEKEIEVGQPETVLISMWDYQNNQSVEYFTPALKFPILQPADEYLYQEYVVVPLAKELFDKMENLAPPMPFIKAAEDTPVSTPAVPVAIPKG